MAGWEDSGESRLASEAEGQIDLDAFESVEELLTLGASPEQAHACFPAESDGDAPVPLLLK